eukprot:SAG11_NODE_16911_length_533_cov_12.327189_1_plen_62_part_10
MAKCTSTTSIITKFTTGFSSISSRSTTVLREEKRATRMERGEAVILRGAHVQLSQAETREKE